MQEPKLRALLAKLEIPVLGKGRDGWLTARCPFAKWNHVGGTDRNPGFGVHINNTGFTAFSCFTCGQHGNLSDLIDKLSYRRGREYFSDLGEPLSISVMMDEAEHSPEPWDELSPPEQENEPAPLSAAMFMGMYPLAWEVPESREYLQARGISERTSRLLELKFEPLDRRIIVPIYDAQRQLFGFNGRTVLPENQWPVPIIGRSPYKKTKDYLGLKKARNIMGIHLADGTKPLYVVEGLFALLHLYEIGAAEWVTPVATLGAHMSDFQRDLIARAGPSVYLGYDNDAAGEQGIYGTLEPDGTYGGGGAADKLRKHMPTFVPLYPYGVNDPDDLTREQLYEMIHVNYTLIT